MAIEFVGMIGVRPEGADGAAVHVIGGAIDMAWIRNFSRAHEDAGFDKVLVGYTSTAADGFLISSYAAAHTERLGYLIAHRPGFVAPTLAARKAATLDQLSGGRVALHIITGGSDGLGRAGAAHIGVMLAKALDDAAPGDKIAVLVAIALIEIAAARARCLRQSAPRPQRTHRRNHRNEGVHLLIHFRLLLFHLFEHIDCGLSNRKDPC